MENQNYKSYLFDQPLDFGKHAGKSLWTIWIEDPAYVLDLFVFDDYFYVKDDFHLYFDLLLTYQLYSVAYGNPGVRRIYRAQKLYDLDYLDILPNDIHHEQLKPILAQYFSLGGFKTEFVLHNYAKYRNHIGKPLLNFELLKESEKEKILNSYVYSYGRKIYSRYTLNDFLQHSDINFKKCWKVVEFILSELATHKESLESEMRSRDEYKRSERAIDEYYEYEDRGSKHYNDDLDMDQQSQEFWDNL